MGLMLDSTAHDVAGNRKHQPHIFPKIMDLVADGVRMVY